MDIHKDVISSRSDDATSDAADSRDVAADANTHEKTFGLAPETAQLVAEDLAATGDRKPASDEVETARAAAARAMEDRS